MKILKVRGQVLMVAACCLLAATAVTAQSGKSAKQAESLEKSGEMAKKSITDVLERLSGMLEQYNTLVDGGLNEKKSQSAYKKLVGDLNTVEKQIDGLNKDMSSLGKEADKFFKAWEKDLETISSDGLRDKSQARMETSKAKYNGIGEALGQSGKILAPVVQNLNDQILFMGRDLSPEALGDLKDEAADLNKQAADAEEQVKTLLEGTAAEAGAEPGAEGDSASEEGGEE